MERATRPQTARAPQVDPVERPHRQALEEECAEPLVMPNLHVRVPGGALFLNAAAASCGTRATSGRATTRGPRAEAARAEMVAFFQKHLA